MMVLNRKTLAEVDARRRGWTPEMISCAADAKKQGLSGSQIAARIEARFGVIFTRNAVIGVLNRLQKNPALKPKVASPPPQPGPPPPGHPLHGLPLIVKRPAPAPLLRADSQPHTLLSLPRGACKWPGKGEGKDTKFCANPAHDGGVYCAFHTLLACGKSQRQEVAE